MSQLGEFKYKFDIGPVGDIDEIEKVHFFGNCRLAIQIYFYKTFNKFFKPEQIVCPQSYESTGKIVEVNTNIALFKQLNIGDVLFAEKIRDNFGNDIDRSVSFYSDDLEKYIISLHTAVFIDKDKKLIWHSTSVENGTCTWDLEKFSYYYKIVRVRRFL